MSCSEHLNWRNRSNDSSSVLHLSPAKSCLAAASLKGFPQRDSLFNPFIIGSRSAKSEIPSSPILFRAIFSSVSVEFCVSMWARATASLSWRRRFERSNDWSDVFFDRAAASWDISNWLSESYAWNPRLNSSTLQEFDSSIVQRGRVHWLPALLLFKISFCSLGWYRTAAQMSASCESSRPQPKNSTSVKVLFSRSPRASSRLLSAEKEDQWKSNLSSVVLLDSPSARLSASFTSIEVVRRRDARFLLYLKMLPIEAQPLCSASTFLTREKWRTRSSDKDIVHKVSRSPRQLMNSSCSHSNGWFFPGTLLRCFSSLIVATIMDWSISTPWMESLQRIEFFGSFFSAAVKASTTSLGWPSLPMLRKVPSSSKTIRISFFKASSSPGIPFR